MLYCQQISHIQAKTNRLHHAFEGKHILTKIKDLLVFYCIYLELIINQ